MAAAWEEPSMRKLIGLCFLTATLLATSAHAQGIFIDRGDPNAINAAVGGGMVKDAWGISALGSWSYRGVFDAGADFIRYAYTAGKNKDIAGYRLTPFVTWHMFRAEEDELPISISATLGVEREMYMGNTPVANPEGWGGYVGPSVYRRFELGTSMVFVPELLVAYEFKATRYYSGALDQTSGNTADQSGGTGYTSESKHSARALLRPNLLVKAGNTKYLVMPYVGYQGGLAFGGNIGAMF
jgi:hypothetical protein